MAISFQGGPLYKKTSTGKIQVWRCVSAEQFIVTRYGQVDGKEQETREEISGGKNIGRVNETTPAQQAYAEAKARHEKQLKKGYVPNIEDAKVGKVDDVIEGGVLPMLAHKFSEQGHKIVYPAYAQPKFDGHRCIAVVRDGGVALWSRTRKPITGLPHINAAIRKWAQANGHDDAVLDGELYNHAYRARFEELTSFIRTPEAKPGHDVVEYHVYDVASSNESQEARLDMLADLQLRAPLVLVETVRVSDEDDLMLAFERFLASGYEGCMVRNAAGKYVNKRSYDLQKVKEFSDDEFKVMGVEEGRGRLAGHAIFVCKTSAGAEFRVKLKGNTANLKHYFDNPEAVIGRQLTVRYQGTTNKTEVPRFPVGVRLRDDV